MGIIRAPFNREWSSTDALRDALIEQDLDNLGKDDLLAIMDLYWEELKPLAIRYLDGKWTDGNDVWQEARDRGYFEDEWDKEHG